MLCTGPAQGKHPMNDGCFHHAWGESPTADTLCLPPTLPLGFGSLDALRPGQEVPRSPRQRGVGLVRRERCQWTLCSFPGMGKRECSRARNRALGQVCREHPLPLHHCLEPHQPVLGPVGRKTRCRGGQACTGPLAHLCTPL